MKNLWLLIGSLGLTLVAVVGVAVLFTNKANAPVAPADGTLVLGSGLHSKGAADAPITIVEFSDFQCPACRAAQPLVNTVLSTASGSARLVYRHFPLRSLHPNAAAAAIAAEAAHEQGKFWEYHDKLYASQSEWEEDSDTTTRFEAYAKELGLDLEKFKQDRANKALEKRVSDDEADGNTLGVNATPTFYVNNVKTSANDLQETVKKLLTQP